MNKSEFHLEALCDFIDDAMLSVVPLTPSHIDDMMRNFCMLGITRVSWAYYADERGGHICCLGDKDEENIFVQRLNNCTNNYHRLKNPLMLAVEAGHKYGIEVYAYFKPYEMGIGLSFPNGSPEAKNFGMVQKIGSKLALFDPYVLEHLNLRIKRRTDDIPVDINTRPICSIKLRKKDNSATRIKKENLQIWTSINNYQYKKLNVQFDLNESTEIADCETMNFSKTEQNRKEYTIRTLTLSNLRLLEPYILVTTNITDGDGDFINSAIDMMRVYDEQGNELTGVYSNGHSIYNAQSINFRNWGLIFDHGYGCRTSALDNSNMAGNDGLIAFARGRNEFLDGALCETEPLVQEFWLDCLKAMLEAGVDGVDFRIENHSTMTDYPNEYGYNQVILDQLSDPLNPNHEEISKIRGDAYSKFLHCSKELIASRGKKMRINFQIDALRTEISQMRLLAYPGNMEFQWKKWINEGLIDEAIFRFFDINFDDAMEDSIGKEVIERCQKHNYPIVFNRYIGDKLLDEFKHIQKDKRFCGFILYEVCSFITYEADGTCTINKDEIKKIPIFLDR